MKSLLPQESSVYIRYQVQTACGDHTASLPMNTKDFIWGVKRPEREANHTIPYNS